jgi:hypothetical protein
LVVAWLLFPLVLLAVCVGCGLAVERIAGWELPGTLLPAVGLALVVVVASLTTTNVTTAPRTTAVIVVLALAGYASSWRRVRALRPEPLATAVGLGVFAVCAAPVVLTGNATFLGYFVNNDPAFHFALADQFLTRGQDLGGLPYSAYVASLHTYMDTSYPVGADVALGAVRPLVGQDLAWIFQPYLAVILALGGMAIYELLRDVVRSRPLRAVCAFIAAQPGLVYAFYLEGSIKEIASTLVITVTVAVVFATFRRRPGLRGAFPLLVTAVAGLDVLSVAIVPWIALPLAVYVAVAAWRARYAIWRMPRARLALSAAASVVVVAPLAGPFISRASTFLATVTGVLGKGTSTAAAQLGNLPGPLTKWQAIGIWPTGDFRFRVATHERVIYALLGVAIASALLGTAWMLRRRAVAPLLLLVSGAIAAVYLYTRGSPYADSKVLMLVSVVVLLTAMIGPVALQQSGRRIEGWVLAAVLAGGVLWTNALQYNFASVAPRDRFAELAAIGTRFSGQGPTLYNQSDEFAIHFLRSDEPDDPATGAVQPRAGLAPRTPAQARLPWDPDDIDFAYLEHYRLLVLGRSPRISRPPSNFVLVDRGRYYDVWKRTSTPDVLEHIPLGGGLYPAAAPGCRVVKATAARAARLHARLAFVVRPPAPALVPTEVAHPTAWGGVDGDPFELIPRAQAGTVTGKIHVTRPGIYQVWLEAALSQRFQIWVGGRRVGSVAYELGPPAQFVHVGQVTLAAGEQPAMVVRPAGNLGPGEDGSDRLVGPLMLVQDPDPPPVAEIGPGRAKSLCGRSLDWLEIVR